LGGGGLNHDKNKARRVLVATAVTTLRWVCLIDPNLFFVMYRQAATMITMFSILHSAMAKSAKCCREFITWHGHLLESCLYNIGQYRSIWKVQCKQSKALLNSAQRRCLFLRLLLWDKRRDKPSNESEIWTSTFSASVLWTSPVAVWSDCLKFRLFTDELAKIFSIFRLASEHATWLVA